MRHMTQPKLRAADIIFFGFTNKDENNLLVRMTTASILEATRRACLNEFHLFSTNFANVSIFTIQLLYIEVTRQHSK